MSNGYNSTSFHLANHPTNLAMRFLLEMSALIAVGYWGWIETRFPYQVMFALGLPLVFAFVWVTVAAPQDRPSGSAAVPVPGIIRLLIELGLFAGAVCSQPTVPLLPGP